MADLDLVEFYKDKNIFITGGSGFVGKALIEKLLRAFPDIGDIYVLIREKRGKSATDRIQDILSNSVFNVLRQKNPSALKKVKPILGDVQEIRLGISDDDEKLLISKVNLIFHVAASVRFDDHLKDAIFTNVRSTREINRLALKCNHMVAMQHVSTVYCNLDKSVTGEEFYPIDFDWKVAIRLAEQGDRSLEVLSQKTISPMPNTYTFSKRLAEAAAVEMCKDKIPLVIVRPSIVIYSISEPEVGWVDNLNGPFALIACGMKGIISTLSGKPEAELDMVFLDNLIKAMILATAEKARSSDTIVSTVSIYNATTDVMVSLNDMIDVQYNLLKKMPYTGRIWYNNIAVTQCWYNYYLQIIFTHVTVAVLVDTILRIIRKKPMLLKVLRRVFVANRVLLFFMNHTITIKNDKYLGLQRNRLDYDKRNEFEYQMYDKPSLGMNQLALMTVMGTKKFIFNEPVPVLEETHRNTFRLYVLRQVFNIFRIILVLYLLLWKFDLISVTTRKITNYWANL